MRQFFPCPAPPRPRLVLYPLFLPFLGCGNRCIFCAQETQCGTRQPDPAALDIALARARAGLCARVVRARPPVELGFYGGTFSGMPPWALDRCLEFCAEEQRAGRALAARCSTRPDALESPRTAFAGGILQRLRRAGIGTVELGVQSFDDTALAASRRGYSSATARAGCAAVLAAGLALGVQLMPGMPGVTPEIFLEDVRTALALGAACLRFYPCLVLEGTELAQHWRRGAYQPWPLENTVETLALALELAQAAAVPVIRMGLAPQPGLETHVLAGPMHPALGSAVRGRALLARVRRVLGDRAGQAFSLELPGHCRGHFWGHAGSLAASWQALGLRAVRFGPGDAGCLVPGEDSAANPARRQRRHRDSGSS